MGPLEDHIHPPEEGEILPSELLYREIEEVVGNIETPASQPSGVSIMQEIHNSPSRIPSSPSYAEILKKKVVDSFGSSDDDSIQSLKKIGRKSRKEVIEEEVERLKMQGSQATIEMNLGRSKRNRPNKGGATRSGIGK